MLDDKNDLGVCSPVRTRIVIDERYADTDTDRSASTLESHILSKSDTVLGVSERAVREEGVAAVVTTERAYFRSTIGTASCWKITIVR